jgi:anti-anti-sigma regulatory factor
MLKLNLIKLERNELLLSAQGGVSLDNLAQFRNVIETLSGKYEKVFLDIGKVNHMDPAAAEMLILTRRKALVAGKTLALVKLSQKISLLVFVKLVTAFGPPSEDHQWSIMQTGCARTDTGFTQE